MKVMAAITRIVSMRDAMLALGLGLSAYGLSLIWVPGAFLFPGAVLVGVAIFGVR